MRPQIGPLPAFVVGWMLAAVFGGGSLFWLMRRAGYSWPQAGVTLAVMTAALFLGSKLLYLIEAWPLYLTTTSESHRAVVSERMRIPGGILLAIAIEPALARLLHVRYRPFTDTITPAAGLCLLGIRIGCFLQGCCYGRPSSLPWAVAFPAAREPVHPLQLYFGVAGLLMFLALSWYQRRKRYDGEVLLWFALTFFWSTWFLELLRGGYTHAFTMQVVLVAAVSVTALVPLAEWRWRVTRRRLPMPERAAATA